MQRRWLLFTLAGLKPLSLRRPSPLASRRPYVDTQPHRPINRQHHHQAPLGKMTWRPTLLSIFLWRRIRALPVHTYVRSLSGKAVGPRSQTRSRDRSGSARPVTELARV
jgi:hypothetical protein